MEFTASPAWSTADIGTQIGLLAHEMFPGGVPVPEGPGAHDRAIQRTQGLMADLSVSAIFEAAFEFDGVRVRVDILERLDNQTWRICEVKSSGSIREKNGKLKDHYSRDAAIQKYVLDGQNGCQIESVQLIFVDKAYLAPDNDIKACELFIREEILEEIQDISASLPDEVIHYMMILQRDNEPEREPAKSKCGQPGGGMCQFWEECTSQKPDDWVDILYKPTKGQIAQLKDSGKERISTLDISDARSTIQENLIRALKQDEDIMAETLAGDLADIALPCIHLDFEYLTGVAIPVFSGMRPFERIPFQYSAHRLNQDGSYEHVQEFLAIGDHDPRRDFIEHLISFLTGNYEPIVVWNAGGAEIATLNDLKKVFPGLESEINSIIERVRDLAPLVRKNVMLRRMLGRKLLKGSGLFSLKNVAPAFDESFSYDNLPGVAHGGQAVESYLQLVNGDLPAGVSKEQMIESLLAYCENDTLGTTLVHKRLLEIVGTI